VALKKRCRYTQGARGDSRARSRGRGKGRELGQGVAEAVKEVRARAGVGQQTGVTCVRACHTQAGKLL
jgi:hypothetical protein